MSNRIKQEIENIEIPVELHERAKLGVMQAKSEQPRRKFKKVAIPLVASTFIVLSAGVAAAHITSFNNLLAIVSPEIALRLQPIEIISESEGIKMEVVAAMNDDEMAVIYVMLQDLTDNRIDKTLDLYDYSLRGATMFNSQIVDYDEQTDTATLRVQANGGESLNNTKVNFRLTSFLSDKKTFEVEVYNSLSKITSNRPQTVLLDTNNITGKSGELSEKFDGQRIVEVLKPNETNIQLPEVDFMNISNIGIIDERLHIQVQWSGNDIDAHGYLYFVNDVDKKVPSSSINFWLNNTEQTKYGNKYTEYIFDMNNVDFEEQKLWGYFVSNGNYIEGNWNTTFKMQSVKDEINIDFAKNFGTWSMKSTSISPIGITLYGNGEYDDSTKMEVSAEMTDGSVQTLDSMIRFSDNDLITVKFLSSLPLDLSKVKAINVNGTDIDLN